MMGPTRQGETPLEFVASAVRAIGAEVDDALPLIRSSQHGHALYGAQPAHGLFHETETWVSSSACSLA